MSGKLGLWLMLTLLLLQVSSSQEQLEEIKHNHQLIEPNERPIKSLFQRDRFFRVCLLRSIYCKDIVDIILTYLDFMPITNVTNLFNDTKLHKPEFIISHNGQWLLYMETCCLYLYDLTTGDLVQRFITPSQSALSSYDMAKSRLFVAGCSEKNIYLWNTNSSFLQTILSGHTKSLIDVRVFLNDTRIFSASNDQTMRIWSVENTLGHCLHVLEGLTYRIVMFYVPVDVMQVCSKSDDGTIHVWNSHNGECIGSYLGHGEIKGMSRDGTRVASVTAGSREITLWNSCNGEIRQTVTNLPISNDIKTVFYISEDRLGFGDGKTIYVWDLQKKEMIYTQSPFDSYLSVHVQDVSGTVDRTYLIIIGRKDEEILMKFYSFESGKIW